MHWVPHVQKHVSSAIDEFFVSKEALSSRDLEGCVVAARAIFGSLINEADARATFQILQEAHMDHYSRFSGQDVSFSAGLGRPRGRSSFAVENRFVEMVDGVGGTNTQNKERAVSSIEFEDAIQWSESETTQNPLSLIKPEAWSDDAGNFDPKVFEVDIESSRAEKGMGENSNQFSAELVEAGIRELHRNLGKGTPPTLFAVVQAIGADCHKRIISQQEAAAVKMLAEGEWGTKLMELKHSEVADGMRQRVALTVSKLIGTICASKGFDRKLDEDILPAVMCAISSEVRPWFQEALLGAVPGAALHDGDGENHIKAVELKVGPTKRANRVAVKIAEYRKEKNQWPYAQFVTDVMRASFICEAAEDFVRAYQGIEASDHFQVVRMKNKIGKCQGPFNLHVNVLFSPQECEDPILCEIQFYPKAVYQLQHRQHLAYELRRASSVKDLI